MNVVWRIFINQGKMSVKAMVQKVGGFNGMGTEDCVIKVALVSEVDIGGCLGHSNHEVIEFKISVDRRKSASKTSALDMRRVNFSLLREFYPCRKTHEVWAGRWIENWLSARSQRILINVTGTSGTSGTYRASLVRATNDVLQDSILVPVLFYLFINDLDEGADASSNMFPIVYVHDFEMLKSTSMNVGVSFLTLAGHSLPFQNQAWEEAILKKKPIVGEKKQMTEANVKEIIWSASHDVKMESESFLLYQALIGSWSILACCPLEQVES
ncbi:hypothetical protein WISP_78589 [Willisornis vidua]|uniref:Uncharacterized protein n=1 Tax=Willisornis vidua TaxID=1566151 RepID=A0ABQ9DAH9_9PASS|nr:hypothetical protein WISP_78589 [Willisornis vidua]